MTAQLFDPATTAVVSIDMQAAVAAHAAEPNAAPDVVARVAALAAAARAAGGLPVFVRTSFLPDEGDNIRPTLDVPRPARPVRPAGWDVIVPEMNVQPTEPVVTKRSFNAFFASDLDLQLRRHGVRTVVMCGISTNFGVDGTARGAYERGYDVIFAREAMAAATVEAHEASMRHVFPYIGRIRDVEEIIAAFAVEEVAA